MDSITVPRLESFFKIFKNFKSFSSSNFPKIYFVMEVYIRVEFYFYSEIFCIKLTLPKMAFVLLKLHRHAQTLSKYLISSVEMELGIIQQYIYKYNRTLWKLHISQVDKLTFSTNFHLQKKKELLKFKKYCIFCL